MIIKEMRKERNLTQEEIASKLNVSQSYYARMEKGKGIITDKVIIKICEIFNCSADELLGIKERKIV